MYTVFNGKEAIFLIDKRSYEHYLRVSVNKPKYVKSKINIDIELTDNITYYNCYEFYYKSANGDNYIYSLETKRMFKKKYYAFYFIKKLTNDEVEKLMRAYFNNELVFKNLNEF